MAREHTDGEKGSLRSSRKALREGLSGSVGLGIDRQLPPLVETLVTFLNDEPQNEADAALRDELRRTVREINAGIYEPGSAPEARLTIDVRIVRQRGNGWTGQYHVVTEPSGAARGDVVTWAMVEALRCGDLARLTICPRCDRAKLMKRPAKFCSDACRTGGTAKTAAERWAAYRQRTKRTAEESRRAFSKRTR